MWQQLTLIEGLIMTAPVKAQKKKLFGVYIDTELIDAIKGEAKRQSRKISAQTEILLRYALNREGEGFDTKVSTDCRNENICGP